MLENVNGFAQTYTKAPLPNADPVLKIAPNFLNEALAKHGFISDYSNKRRNQCSQCIAGAGVPWQNIAALLLKG